MAVKKTAKKDESGTPTKATAKDTATKTTKKSAPKKAAAAPPASAPKAAEKPAATKTAAPKKAAKPKAAPVKLTDSQKELLKKVHGAGEAGYAPEKKIEERSLASLQEKKLIKKGAKDKATGKVPYSVSASGKKHIGGEGGSASTPPTA